ncbi:MAG: glycosyltransferase family 8 protein [Helicobacter sp.]|nr:glycosyltransferase family 8 protein [Helicobacter sp.]
MAFYTLCFTANEPYLPYTSVLITSIIAHARPDSTFAPLPFAFHILTDSVSEEGEAKMRALESALNERYPCKIFLHTMDESDFANVPLFADHQNHLSSYRLRLSSVIPSGTERVLYLDSDMLALADVRELFGIHLGEHIAAVVPDCSVRHQKFYPKRGKNAPKIHLKDHIYFNSGLLLLDYVRYQKAQIEDKCFALLRDYQTHRHDQDVLNIALFGHVRYLSFSYNCMLNLFPERYNQPPLRFLGEKSARVNLTREEYESAVQSPKIAHFALNPWDSVYRKLDYHFKPIPYPHRELWWEAAAQTPVFSEELLAQKSDKRRDMAAYTVALSERLQNCEKQINRLRAPFMAFTRLRNTIRQWLAKPRNPPAPPAPSARVAPHDSFYTIVLTANESYAPYMAVLIQSIITQALNTDYPPLPFAFHILTDGFSEEMARNLRAFESAQNARYPCSFFIHKLEDSEFAHLPKYAHHTNHLIYYRLRLSSVIPSNTERVLYLDSDMLALADVRELFTIDLGKHTAAVVADHAKIRAFAPRKGSKTGSKTLKLGKHCYFNSGLLLLDFARYTAENIEQKALAFVQDYQTEYHDQDALNAALAGKVCYLPFAWNCMYNTKADIRGTRLHYVGEKGEPSVVFSRAEYENAVQNPKIAHFGLKPWNSAYMRLGKNLRPVPYPHRALWWEAAAETPIFGEILLAQKDNFEQDFSAHISALHGRFLDNHKRLERLRAPGRFISTNLKKLRFWKR